MAATHAELVALAASWLRRRRRATIVLAEYRSVMVSEHPDAIGWNGAGWSVLVECKASRADFLRDKSKIARRFSADAMGQERFYLCPPGVIDQADLPEGWGLLWTSDRGVRQVVAAERGQWRRERQRHEFVMVLAALRRALENGATLKYQPKPNRLGAKATSPAQEQPCAD